MNQEQTARMEAQMMKCLGEATDEQIEDVAKLVFQQVMTIRMMKNQPPNERMALASHCTQLRAQSDAQWLALMGIGVKMVTTPDGDARGFGFFQDTGEAIPQVFETHHLGEKK